MENRPSVNHHWVRMWRKLFPTSSSVQLLWRRQSHCVTFDPTGGFLFDIPPAQSSACSAPDPISKNDAHTDEVRYASEVLLMMVLCASYQIRNDTRQEDAYLVAADEKDVAHVQMVSNSMSRSRSAAADIARAEDEQALQPREPR
jgi:hypothetical protein